MNQIQVIRPYRVGITGWAFDDEEKGLKKEPFVLGIDSMIDALVPKGVNQIKIYFSSFEFPEAQRIRKLREEFRGAWYTDVNGSEGWLCPALLKYFDTPPDDIYFLIEVEK